MRLAELIGTLSLAVDAGTGLPDFHALRGATLAVGLAREVKADERTVRDAFYLPLLAMAGCTAESHASARMLGDEVLVGTESYGLDWGDPREMLPVMLRLVRRGHGPLGGLAAIVRAFGSMAAARRSGARIARWRRRSPSDSDSTRYFVLRYFRRSNAGTVAGSHSR